ncbi:hypothetical protein [Sinomonas sp. R1AF57]|uniref:hypothetical protein n=1 Tax=Sinomonas sp. R1AF57 TaxID=2020377 RepID=UPI000B5E1A61|nr:hypothetical protein [Sinomonas sp. R1AF57]ASN52494.1 hypothetical protein CGQ25_10755 [Sinomonas sp. R1AF57]
MTTYLQNITIYEPSTGALRTAAGVRRADTVHRIKELGGDHEEFLVDVVKGEPERRAPWTSKSGNTVVVFQPQREDPRNEWEPEPGAVGGATTANTKRFRCTECGRESNAGGLALHHKASGHSGSVPVVAAEAEA